MIMPTYGFKIGDIKCASELDSAIGYVLNAFGESPPSTSFYGGITTRRRTTEGYLFSDADVYADHVRQTPWHGSPHRAVIEDNGNLEYQTSNVYGWLRGTLCGDVSVRQTSGHRHPELRMDGRYKGHDCRVTLIFPKGRKEYCGGALGKFRLEVSGCEHAAEPLYQQLRDNIAPGKPRQRFRLGFSLRRALPIP
jgi:hypothetical protein